MDSMKRKPLQIVGQLIQLVKPLRMQMVGAILLGLFGHLLATVLMPLAAWGLLVGLGIFKAPSVPLIVLFMALAAGLRGLCRYGEQTFNHAIAFRLLALIRDRVFAALRRLCPAKLEGRQKGDLISLITTDVELLEVFYAHTLSPIGLALLYTVILVAALSWIHPLIGLFALLCYLFLGVCLPWFIARRGQAQAARQRQGSGQLASQVLETLKGLDQIVQFNAEALRRNQLNQQMETLETLETKRHELAATSQAGINAIILVMDFLLFALACVVTDWPGALLATFTFVASLGPTLALSALGMTLQSTLAAGDRVLGLLAEKPAVEAVVGEQPLALVQGQAPDLKAEAVSFAYEASPVLRALTLSLQPGQRIGLQGESGCGKSTLLKLMMRFWDPDAGRLLLAGRDLRQVNTTELRKQVTYLAQETQLFSETVADNLRLADPTASQAELEAVCQQVGLDERIKALPQGYETPLGENGETLSAGERQRLGLARALLKKAPILLLDEPTSHLDALNEAKLLQALKTLPEDQTVVLVSHRPSTLKQMTQRYQMQAGELKPCEEGGQP